DDYNIIVHLHYYRSRPVPDRGFHKDTAGQTAFFILHYLNAQNMYGPEWMYEPRLTRKWKYKQSLTEMSLGDPPREGPTEQELYWPAPLTKDVKALKEKGQNDDKMHVMRVEPSGAVLVVDEAVVHRSPHPNSREHWRDRSAQIVLPQTSTVQATDVRGKVF